MFDFKKLKFLFMDYDKEGYDREGYGKDGHNREGYNRQGYDRQGYDKNGYNREGYNRRGYDREGYNKEGYSKSSYTRNGYDKNGYNRQEYNIDGYNIWGYRKDGYDKNGFDKNGIHRNGTYYDEEGYDSRGLNRDGFDRDGYNTSGLDKDGFYKNGYDKEGYNKERYNKQGHTRGGYDDNGSNKSDYNREDYNIQEYDKAGYDKLGYDQNGYNSEGYNKRSYNKEGVYDIEITKNNRLIVTKLWINEVLRLEQERLSHNDVICVKTDMGECVGCIKGILGEKIRLSLLNEKIMFALIENISNQYISIRAVSLNEYEEQKFRISNLLPLNDEELLDDFKISLEEKIVNELIEEYRGNDYKETRHNIVEYFHSLDTKEARKNEVNRVRYNLLINVNKENFDTVKLILEENGILNVLNDKMFLAYLILSRGSGIEYILSEFNKNEVWQQIAVEFGYEKYINYPLGKIMIRYWRLFGDFKKDERMIEAIAERQKNEIKNSPEVIEEIAFPSLEMEMIAIQKNPYLLGKIKKPSEKIQLFALDECQRQNRSYPSITHITSRIGQEIILNSNGTYAYILIRSNINLNLSLQCKYAKIYPINFLVNPNYKVDEAINIAIHEYIIRKYYFNFEDYRSSYTEMSDQDLLLAFFSRFHSIYEVVPDKKMYANMYGKFELTHLDENHNFIRRKFNTYYYEYKERMEYVDIDVDNYNNDYYEDYTDEEEEFYRYQQEQIKEANWEKADVTSDYDSGYDDSSYNYDWDYDNTGGDYVPSDDASF